MITFAIAIKLAGPASGLPDVSAAYQNAILTYAACVETKMVELEPSKADIDDIFEAANMQCAAVRVDSIFIIQNDFEKSPPSISGKSALQMTIEILDGVALMSKNRSRVAILRKRAGLPPIDVQRL
ncbi:MAG: hypothetical protein ABI673_03110 [Novosphingobium sp.]